MNFTNQKVKTFFYKYWWVYYILFFLFLGLLIYAIMSPYNNIYTNNEIEALNKRLDDCCNSKRTKIIENDSIRVINNNGKFGCLSFTLVWNSIDDLDLHVFDPLDNHIFYQKYCKSKDNIFSSAGGQLDIDLNAGDIFSEQPVENVYFKCTPPNGAYIVKVHLYTKRNPSATSYNLIVREKSKIIDEISGVIGEKDELVEIINYSYNGD